MISKGTRSQRASAPAREASQLNFLSDEDEEEADTLAGLVFKIAGRVPTRGEIIRHESGLEFEILESDPRRVKRVRINAKNLVMADGDVSGDRGSG